MKKLFAIILMAVCLGSSQAECINIELNASYDNFRGIPDGSWNGNNGALLSGNAAVCIADMFSVQAGGSYGLYNWDGRQNLVFRNPKALQTESFITAGIATLIGPFNLGLVYDRVFTRHFGIYDLSPSFDQLRFQAGYQFCCDEFGVWGTAHLETSHKNALGLPISYRAIDQINLFWSHYFDNCAKTTLWAGLPYRDSLRYEHRAAGEFILGFSARVPLTDCLYLDGHGAYMRARQASGAFQSLNYAANICIGITYLFDGCGCEDCSIYMPVANNSNFLIDTNLNQ